jgi:aspartyl-tRNA(Asn)/glutamyl-tRNA(Gln) amidotransferase subunit A
VIPRIVGGVTRRDRSFATERRRQIRDGIADKLFTARETAEAALGRIDDLDGQVHAFNQVTAELAYAAAERIDDAVVSGVVCRRWPACPWPSRTT